MCRSLPVELEHVEDHVDERERRAAAEEPLADEREVGPPILAERDELAVEDGVDREQLRAPGGAPSCASRGGYER